MHVSNNKYLEGIKLYWGSKDCKKDNKVKKYQRMKQAIKKIQRTTWKKKDIKWKMDIMIRVKKERSK